MEKNKENQDQHIHEEPEIKTYELGDEYHPVNPDDEVIEYIGERIRALDHLEKCTKLKKLLFAIPVICYSPHILFFKNFFLRIST